jgi:hypothetical protein
LPAAWVAALNDAVARKAIPDVGIPKLGADGNPAYPNGLLTSLIYFYIAFILSQVATEAAPKFAPAHMGAESTGTSGMVPTATSE